MKSKIIIVAFAIGCGCKDPQPITPSPVPPGIENCKAGCDHLKELKCEEALGSNPNNPNSCTEDCQYVLKEGKVDLKVNCWTTIIKCEELETKCR